MGVQEEEGGRREEAWVVATNERCLCVCGLPE